MNPKNLPTDSPRPFRKAKVSKRVRVMVRAAAAKAPDPAVAATGDQVPAVMGPAAQAPVAAVRADPGRVTARTNKIYVHARG